VANDVKEKWVEVDDTNIVAYLHYKGFRFCPFKKGEDDRVGFRVYGDIDEALSEFYDNTKVGVQDYVGCLKKVRGSLFLIKGMESSKTEQKRKKEE
jgi:hypothetical protein